MIFGGKLFLFPPGFDRVDIAYTYYKHFLRTRKMLVHYALGALVTGLGKLWFKHVID